MIHLISVLSEHMVFMTKICISKDECVPSTENRGHFLARVIIFQLTQLSTTNVFLKSSILTDIDKMVFQRWDILITSVYYFY